MPMSGIGVRFGFSRLWVPEIGARRRRARCSTVPVGGTVHVTGVANGHAITTMLITTFGWAAVPSWSCGGEQSCSHSRVCRAVDGCPR
jgi:hypothetical protein